MIKLKLRKDPYDSRITVLLKNPFTYVLYFKNGKLILPLNSPVEILYLKEGNKILDTKYFQSD